MRRPLVPALEGLGTCLAVAVLSSLPWGVPDGLRFGVPLAAFVPVFHWSRRAPQRVPLTGVAAIGLLIDLLTMGPLGYWSLLYVLGQAAALAMPRSRQPVVAWLADLALLGALVLGLALVGWAVASLYFVAPISVLPLFTGSVAVAAANIPASLLFLGRRSPALPAEGVSLRLTEPAERR